MDTNTTVDALRQAAPLELIDYIVRGPHEKLPVQVMTLEGLLRLPREPDDAPLLAVLDRLLGELWRALEPYLMTEERALFPLLQSVLAMRVAGRSGIPSAAELSSGPLETVRQAHVRLWEGLDALSDLLTHWPRDSESQELSVSLAPVRTVLCSFCAELRSFLRVEAELLLPALIRA
jgi:iron-sulfur cluster repair protein YtfE (RIC family)